MLWIQLSEINCSIIINSISKILKLNMKEYSRKIMWHISKHDCILIVGRYISIYFKYAAGPCGSIYLFYVQNVQFLNYPRPQWRQQYLLLCHIIDCTGVMNLIVIKPHVSEYQHALFTSEQCKTANSEHFIV